MKILQLITSPRGEASISIKLGNAIVKELKSVSSDSQLTVRDLTKNPFPHLEEVHLNSFFTPAAQRTNELNEAIKHSDAALAELKDADVIVIGVPMYNFTIPSTLKVWIDHIARAGQTFRYTDKGPEGLLKNKKVYLAIATGGVYSGAEKAGDFTESYLRAVLSHLGITDITAFRAEGVNMPQFKLNALQKAIDSIQID